MFVFEEGIIIIQCPIFSRRNYLNKILSISEWQHEIVDGKHIKENKVSFTLGQRGCTLLESNGFHYVRNRRSGYKTYWICAKKGSTKCKARVVTNIIDGVQKIVLKSCSHNHPIHTERKKRKKQTVNEPAISLMDFSLNI
ncbi:hypothetical protein ACFFRR_005604 [Megaselia abdita]